MSSCFLLKSSALALGIGTVAQVPVPEALSAYREYGVIGLLILAVIGLWLDATRKERDAQTRRDEREKRRKPTARIATGKTTSERKSSLPPLST